MAEKTPKTILLVDDEKGIRQELAEAFTDCNEQADCPYEFQVEQATSAEEGAQKIRAREYDVIVLDVRMESVHSGLELAHTLGERFGSNTPVRIIFTGFDTGCVDAMRAGAWDFILKEDVPGTGDHERRSIRHAFLLKPDVPGTLAARVVVDSALIRLRQLDLRREQEARIAAWSPAHLHELEEKYGGQIIALWHGPEVTVIASGRDAFEVEDRLRGWREAHKDRPWEQPYLLQIPAVPRDYKVEE